MACTFRKEFKENKFNRKITEKNLITFTFKATSVIFNKI